MISEFRLNLPQVLAVSVKNVVLIGFGMALGFPTILIPSLQEITDSGNDLILNSTQISWISSLNLICVPLGCVFSGSFTTLIGRRRAMQLVNLPIFASWIVFYYAKHVSHLYIALCLGGFTGGMLEAPVLTYVAEISTPKIRGMLSATGSTCIIIGVFSQFIMGSFMTWRSITLVSSIIPIVAILLLFLVPESPHWLILKNRDEDAKKALMWLRGWQVTFDGVKFEFDELHKNLTARISAEDGNNDSILKPFKRRTFILPYFICSLSFFIGHFSGMTTLQTYAVPIFAQLKAPIDKYFATMLLGVLELLGTIICVILVKFVGKRKLTFFSTFGCGTCFLLTACYAYFIDDIPGEIVKNNIISNVTMVDTTTVISTTKLLTTESDFKPISNEYVSSFEISANEVNESAAILNGAQIHLSDYSWLPLIFLLTSALLSHSGIRLLPWMLIGEVFPGKIRGVSAGISGATGYIFGFLANKLFLSMIAALTLAGTFLLYSSISVVGCIILYMVLPETEGRTLQQIENHFSGKRKLPKTLIRKEPVSEEPFPSPFNVQSWESNEKFEKVLKQRNISQLSNGKIHHKHNAVGLKRKIHTITGAIHNNNDIVNDDTIDTHL
uniref:Gustatory receptor 1 n=1 Tax=Propsilocerus akamusi TaxID=903466 RepID=A0A7D0P9Z1_9DIPT|nr:gustatory receptor 1 [Propsilocerus akamusi]